MDSQERKPSRAISRRDVLKGIVVGGAGAAGATVIPGSSARALPALMRQGQIDIGPVGLCLLCRFGPTPDLVKSVRRADDLLVLDFAFYNLHLVTRGGAPHLERVDSRRTATIVVALPPQAIGEQTTPEQSLTPKTPVPTIAAGPSRLAFKFDHDVSIPYTLPSLLNWSAWAPNLAAEAQAPSGPPQGAPDPLVTALEVPWGLILSPVNPTVAYRHAASDVPVTRNGRTELWHTQVMDTVDVPTTAVRAIWTPGFNPKRGGSPSTTDPFEMPLPAFRRNQLVHNMTNPAATTDVAPAQAKRLMLTSQGGWLDVEGEWTLQPGGGPFGGNGYSTIERWVHRATHGRDHFVRIDDKGWLFPFGHRCTKVTISERRLENDPNGDITAYLRKREFIIVRTPTKAYGGAAFNQPDGGQDLPFTSITILTEVTPDIDQPTAQEDQSFFWPQVNGADLLWHCSGVDWRGNVIEFTTPLEFVSESFAFNQCTAEELVQTYNGLAPSDGKRLRSLAGQRVALAPAAAGFDTRTTHQTQSVLFQARTPLGVVCQTGAGVDPAYEEHAQPPWYPSMLLANVVAPEADAVSRAGALGTLAVSRFVHGDGQTLIAANDSGVYLHVLNPPALKFGGDKAGGLATPDFSLGGFSNKVGSFGGDPATFGDKGFSPSAYFGDAKLLGGVSLADVISETGLDLTKIPQLVNQHVLDPTTHHPTVVTSFDWKPQVQSATTTPIFVTETNSSFTLSGRVVTDLVDPAGSIFDLQGNLVGFGLTFFGGGSPDAGTLFIKVHFDTVRFHTRTGMKPEIAVGLSSPTSPNNPATTPIEFLGPLSFVADLANLLPPIGGNGLSIDVGAGGISATYHIALPSIAVGMFAITNLSLSAGLNIPFTGDPARLRFGLASRDDPFLVQVMIFAGGGWVSVALGTDGLEAIEVGLEFAASISLDLGVASGGVSIGAGIYILFSKEGIDLTGFVRMAGYLNILDLITASVEFYMSLEYDSGTGKVIGRASLTVAVDVGVFHTSAELSVERRFGHGADPTFEQMLPTKALWDDYCTAFAVSAA